jgi:hypothetical protein
MNRHRLVATAALLLSLLGSPHPVPAAEADCTVRLKEAASVEVLELRGTCRNGYVEGWARVRYTLSDGKQDGYEGEHRDGWRDGEGTYYVHDGGVYVGDYRRSVPHGEGRWTGPDGWSYEGGWVDNKYHGRGQLSHEDGRRWVGEFRNGLLNGEAIFTGSGELRYEGRFQDGKTHGEGTMRYANGQEYVGDWKDGKRHGDGALTDPDGRRWVGEWENDQMHGHVVYGKPDGAGYEGHYREGSWDGQGTLTAADGAVYVGGWKKGKMDGQGRWTWADGSVYDGEWSDGKRHGRGTHWTADGAVDFEGEWVRDGRRPDGGYRTTRWGMSPQEAIAALPTETIVPMEANPNPRFRKEHDLPRGRGQELFCGSKKYSGERDFYFYKDTILGHPATVFLCFNHEGEGWNQPGLFQVRVNFSRPRLHTAAEVAQALEAKYGGSAHTSRYTEAGEYTSSSQTEQWTWPVAGIWMKYSSTGFLWLQYGPPESRPVQSSEGL